MDVCDLTAFRVDSSGGDHEGGCGAAVVKQCEQQLRLNISVAYDPKGPTFSRLNDLKRKNCKMKSGYWTRS